MKKLLLLLIIVTTSCSSRVACDNSAVVEFLMSILIPLEVLP